VLQSPVPSQKPPLPLLTTDEIAVDCEPLEPLEPVVVVAPVATALPDPELPDAVAVPTPLDVWAPVAVPDPLLPGPTTTPELVAPPAPPEPPAPPGMPSTLEPHAPSTPTPATIISTRYIDTGHLQEVRGRSCLGSYMGSRAHVAGPAYMAAPSVAHFEIVLSPDPARLPGWYGVAMRAARVLVAVALAGCAPTGAPPPAAVSVAAAPTVFAPVWEPMPVRVAAPVEPVQGPSPPFLPGQELVGKYTCTQGITDLRLRIVSVEGTAVAATFEFEHAPTRAAGSYELSGTWDPTTRRMVFTPGAWLVRPSGYEPVGMDGRIPVDASSYAGRITHPTCGAFSVQATR
jgi:hypothetical protein